LNDDQKIKILVVDDDQQYQRFLGALLADMGYYPVLARTGWEALEDCQKEEPQIVLTDIFMPYLDGVEFMGLIRRAKYFIPIIAMTGSITGKGKEHHLQTAWLQGADEVITKPINPEVLQDKIEALLKTYGNLREARSKDESVGAVEGDEGNAESPSEESFKEKE